MRFNADTHDGVIMLAADRSRGIWAAEVATRAIKTSRTAGRLNTSASTHTLLAVGLTSVLHSISRKMAARITRPGIVLPRIVVATDDGDFADSLAQYLQRGQSTTPLRAGKIFRDLLIQQIHRFNVTFESAPEGPMTGLRLWSRRVVLDPRLVTTVPAVLIPAASSTLA